MKRRIARTALAALALATLAASAPAGANHTNVTVGFRKSMLRTHSSEDAVCSVVVKHNADGVAVLDAAVAKGCIESYELKTFDFGEMLTCIDDLCQQPDAFPLTYWSMLLDGVETSYGVRGYRAAQGNALEFSYTTWLFCFAECDPIP